MSRPLGGRRKLVSLASVACLTGWGLALAWAGPMATPAAGDAIVSGGVVAWGNSSVTAVPAAARSGIVAIAAGREHALALTGGGSVVAWGLNDHGQTKVPAGLGQVSKIAAGAFFSVALKADGSVVVWGDNSAHQAEVPPQAQSGVVDVAAGSNTVIALKSDGSIVAWGDDCCGQSSIPVAYKPLLKGQVRVPLSNLKAISVSDQVLAIQSDGSVVSWGDNRYGQGAVPASLTEATAVAAGGDFSLALRPDGTIVGWGDDFYHQIDVPCSTPKIRPCKAPIAGFTAIAAGSHHSVALKSDGTVFAWGLSWDLETRVPAKLSSVQAVAAGGDFSLALTGTIPPYPPIFVSAWAGNASATISWVAPFDGNSPITGYVVTASPGGQICRSDGATTTCTISGLTNGQSYTFSVAARNKQGSSAASQASNRVIPSLNATAPPATPRPTPTSPPGQRPAVVVPEVPPPNTTPAVVLLTIIGLAALAVGFGLPSRLIERRRTSRA